MSLSLGEVTGKIQKIRTLIADMSASEIRDVIAILEYEAWRKDNDKTDSHDGKA